LYIPAPRFRQGIFGSLQYEFQGFTKDGDYYLSGSYSIETDLLPATQADISEDDLARASSEDDIIYNEYIAEIRAILSNASSGDFTPSQEAVQAVFASFTY
jgi:hypothetical protein